MTYATLMVHMEVGESNDAVLGVAASLARRFGATVIGLGACQLTVMSGPVTGEIIELEREGIRSELARSETQFRTALAGRVDHLEWRGAMVLGSLAQQVALEARAADLIITRPDRGVGLLNSSTRMSVGDLAMSAGRPILVVPEGVKTLGLDRVVVAWNDSRESRRAIVDALPLLRGAGQVAVVEVASKDLLAETRAHLEDVETWLKRHGVEAKAVALPSGKLDAVRFADLGFDSNADLIVAGAYGHARLLEWAFGGVTCDLLLHPGSCALISH